MKKKIRNSILSIAVVFLSLSGIVTMQVHAAVNESVTLRPTPPVADTITGITSESIVAPVDQAYQLPINENGVLVFGQTSGGSSSSGVENTYTPPPIKTIDLSQLVMTSVADLESSLANESNPPQLLAHLALFSEMNELLKAHPVTDYVLPGTLQTLIAPQSQYVADGTVSAADLRLYNLFDVWFPGCEDLGGECVMLTFDLSTVTTGIYAFLQYENGAFSVIPAQNVIANEARLVTITFERITPVALLTISQNQIDAILNPPPQTEPPQTEPPATRYMGEPAVAAIAAGGGVIAAECAAAAVVFNWSRVAAVLRKLKVRKGRFWKMRMWMPVPLLALARVAPSSIIVLVAEGAAALVLGVMIVQQIRYNIHASRSHLSDATPPADSQTTDAEQSRSEQRKP